MVGVGMLPVGSTSWVQGIRGSFVPWVLKYCRSRGMELIINWWLRPMGYAGVVLLPHVSGGHVSVIWLVFMMRIHCVLYDVQYMRRI